MLVLTHKVTLLELVVIMGVFNILTLYCSMAYTVAYTGLSSHHAKNRLLSIRCLTDDHSYVPMSFLDGLCYLQVVPMVSPRALLVQMVFSTAIAWHRQCARCGSRQIDYGHLPNVRCVRRVCRCS